MSNFLLNGGGLIAQGSYGCVFYPGIKKDGKEFKKKKLVSKLQKNNKNTDNEIKIGKIIQKIKIKDNTGILIGWEHYFSPVIYSYPINTNNINNKIIKDCSIIEKKNNDLMLLQSNYIGPELLHFLINNRDKITFTTHILIDTYKHILKGINILTSNYIVHYDIKPNNILIDVDKIIPIIIPINIPTNADTIKILYN